MALLVLKPMEGHEDTIMRPDALAHRATRRMVCNRTQSQQSDPPPHRRRQVAFATESEKPMRSGVGSYASCSVGSNIALHRTSSMHTQPQRTQIPKNHSSLIPHPIQQSPQSANYFTVPEVQLLEDEETLRIDFKWSGFAEKRQLQEELCKARNNCKNLSELLRSHRSNFRQEKQKNTDLKFENQRLSQDNAALSSAHGQLEHKLTAITDSFGQNQRDHAALKRKYSKLSHVELELVEVRDKFKNLTQENATLKCNNYDLRQSEEKLTEVTGEHEKLKQDHAILQSGCSDLRQSKHEVFEVQAKYQKSLKETATLNSRFSALVKIVNAMNRRSSALIMNCGFNQQYIQHESHEYQKGSNGRSFHFPTMTISPIAGKECPWIMENARLSIAIPTSSRSGGGFFTIAEPGFSESEATLVEAPASNEITATPPVDESASRRVMFLTPTNKSTSSTVFEPLPPPPTPRSFDNNSYLDTPRSPTSMNTGYRRPDPNENFICLRKFNHVNDEKVCSFEEERMSTLKTKHRIRLWKEDAHGINNFSEEDMRLALTKTQGGFTALWSLESSPAHKKIKVGNQVHISQGCEDDSQ